MADKKEVAKTVKEPQQEKKSIEQSQIEQLQQQLQAINNQLISTKSRAFELSEEVGTYRQFIQVVSESIQYKGDLQGLINYIITNHNPAK